MFFYFKNKRGFTLVEIMIVVAIVSILAAIAIPSYQNSILKGRRGDAKGEMLRLAQLEEKWRVSNTTYGSLADIGGARNTNYYTFTLANNTATTYTITGTPASYGGQDQDDCAILTLTETAIITSSAPANCPNP